MDELAEKLGMDPIELRKINDTSVDPEKGVPFSSRSLTAALEEGARRFGWDRRTEAGRPARGRMAGRHGRRLGRARQYADGIRRPRSRSIPTAPPRSPQR